MNNIQKITVLVPLYNEAPVLQELFNRLQNLKVNSGAAVSFVFVDDGSTDNTTEVLKEYISGKENYSAVFLSRNFGHAMAITAGLESLPTDTDAVFIIDGDLQDPPELLSSFVEKMNNGYDVVYGIRKRRKESWFKKLAYTSYYRLLKRSANIKMPLDAGDFSLISKRVVQHLIAMPEESRYLRGLRSWVGFKQAGIEYERDERKGGNSKYSFGKLLKLAFNGFFNFSELPVRFIGRVGLITVLVALGYLGITLYKKLMYGTVPEGFTALIFAIVLFSGVQLMSLGILGEYILRIFFQVKNRPLYIVESKIINGKSVDE